MFPSVLPPEFHSRLEVDAYTGLISESQPSPPSSEVKLEGFTELLNNDRKVSTFSFWLSCLPLLAAYYKAQQLGIWVCLNSHLPTPCVDTVE